MFICCGSIWGGKNENSWANYLTGGGGRLSGHRDRIPRRIWRFITRAALIAWRWHQSRLWDGIFTTIIIALGVRSVCLITSFAKSTPAGINQLKKWLNRLNLNNKKKKKKNDGGECGWRQKWNPSGKAHRREPPRGNRGEWVGGWGISEKRRRFPETAVSKNRHCITFRLPR